MLQALRIRRLELGPAHWKVGDADNDLGALYYQIGRYDDAAAYWQESLAISERWAGRDHPEVGTVANNIGRSLLIAGKPADAKPYLEKALDRIAGALAKR